MLKAEEGNVSTSIHFTKRHCIQSIENAFMCYVSVGKIHKCTEKGHCGVTEGNVDLPALFLTNFLNVAGMQKLKMNSVTFK